MSTEITFQIEIVRFYDGTGEFTQTIIGPSGNIIENQEISTAINLIEQKPGILNVEVQVEVEVESEQTAKEKSLPITTKIQAAVDTDKANIKTTIDETEYVTSRIDGNKALVENTIDELSVKLEQISDKVIELRYKYGLIDNLIVFKVDEIKKSFIITILEGQVIPNILEALANAFVAAASCTINEDIKNMAIMLAAIIFKNRTIIKPAVEP